MILGHVFIATSLDGFIARIDGDIEWLLSRDDPSEDHGYNDFIQDIDGIIMGRGSYEKMLSFESWPHTKPVVVLSKSLESSGLPEKLHGTVRILDLQPKEAMRRMSDEGWKNVYVDGGQIIQSFLRDGLIHDMVITVVPVLIGRGRPLFGDLYEDVSLSLISSKTFPSGLVQCKYQVIQ